MVKKSSLAYKLAGYSALAAGVLAANKSDGQIIYTGITPNIQLSSKGDTAYDSSYYLDLNNDGVADFQLRVTRDVINLTNGNGHETFSMVSALPLNSNKVDADTADAYGNAIGSKLSWKSFGMLASHYAYHTKNGSHHSSVYGAFTNLNNVYLPLQLVTNGKNYYGWVRLSVNNEDSLAVISYAYNTVPDSSIIAGNTGCSKSPATPLITQLNDTLQSTPALTYQWFKGDTLLVNDTSQFIVAATAGYYSVLTIDSNGCLTQSVVYPDSIAAVSGIEPVTLTNNVFIYSYEKTAHIILSNEKLIGSKVSVYNILGEQVISTIISSSQTIINLNDFAPGLYIIKIGGKDSAIEKKIITE